MTLLSHRIAAFGGDSSAEEILERSAVERLWEFDAAEADRSLRMTLQIAHTALTEAARDELEAISRRLVETAVAAWPPPEHR